jgi:hypothetical protein
MHLINKTAFSYSYALAQEQQEYLQLKVAKKEFLTAIIRRN